MLLRVLRAAVTTALSRECPALASSPAATSNDGDSTAAAMRRNQLPMTRPPFRGPANLQTPGGEGVCRGGDGRLRPSAGTLSRGSCGKASDAPSPHPYGFALPPFASAVPAGPRRRG